MLIPILKDVYEEIFKKEEMSNFMGIGLIRLIYKRKGDCKEIEKIIDQ